MAIEDDLLKASNKKNINQLTSLLNIITTFSLSGNKIGNQDASTIGEALKDNTMLTTLVLYGNQIGDSGASEIAKTLETNKTLTLLDLQGNQIGEKKKKQIEDLIKRNRRFRNDCSNALKQNNLSTAKTLLNQGVSSNGVLFELARDTNTRLKAIQHLFQLT